MTNWIQVTYSSWNWLLNMYIYIYKTCIIYVYTCKHQPVHTYQYSKFRKILFYQESTAGCGASAVRVGVATFCRREPVTCGEITPHLATFESRTSYKWPAKSPTPCLSKNLRAQSQKTLVSQSWCTIHTPKCLKYAKINKNCFCLPGATYATFVSPCTFTWCSCALTSFKDYAFKECQKCLLLKKMPQHAPHAALNNDPLKPFFREHKSPHFAVEMNRWIPLYVLRKETPASENPHQCLGRLTTKHAALRALQWLQPCAKSSSYGNNNRIQWSVTVNGYLWYLISAHWFGGPTCYWSALPLGLPLHNQPLPWHGCHLHSSSRLHW